MTHSPRSAPARLACLLPILLLDATQVRGQSGPLWGFADTHTHQFANLAFGGALLIGEPFAPSAPAGREIEFALIKCEYASNFIVANPLGIPIPGVPFAGQPLHSQVFSPDLIGIFLDGHAHAVEGYPNFNGWPHWTTHTHQQMYWEWLHRAYVGGLRLMVMLAVNNEVLCSISNRRLGLGCDDMSAVDRQIQGAKDLEAHIDRLSGGPGLGWYRIAYSGRQAREIIAGGKLAVVLGIEVDDLFACVQSGTCTPDFVRSEIQRYRDLGVRHIFPLHLFDNAFGGAALYDDFFNLGNALATGSYYQVGGCGPDCCYGYDFDPGTDPLVQGFLNTFPFLRAFIPSYPPGPHCNARGLTGLGETLIRELMASGMIVDVDHMSARALNRTLEICEETGYPLVAGHTGFKDLTLGEKASEIQKTTQQLERLRRLGGLVSTGLNQGELGEIAHFDSRIPLTCGNSSQTFAQAYLYAVNAMDGAAVGVGSDFNGLAGMPGPRFHARCSGQGNPISYPFLVHGGGAVLDKHIAGNRLFNYNSDGFAHVGLYPDFIEDLKVQGLTRQDLDPLFRSAEAYVRLWERIDARTHAPCAPRAAGFNLSTGFDEAAGQLIANGRSDDNFEVEGPFGLGLGVACARVVPDNGYPIGPWMATTPGSKWIGLPSPNSEGPPGEYVFSVTVNVPPGVNAAALVLVGGWAADDATRNIIVNHVSTGITGGGNGFFALTPFPPQAARGFFRPGENVIEFVIENGGTSVNPIGIRVEAVLQSLAGVDLAVEQSIIDFGRVHAGDSFHITDAFANLASGIDTAFGAVARYRISHPSVGEFPIGERYLPPLAPGVRSEGATRVTVPESLPPGTYQLRVEVATPPPATELDPASNRLDLFTLQVFAAPSRRFLADDFNRADGPPSGWTADSCTWRIAGGALATGPTGSDECWIWAGAPPVTAPGRMVYSFDYRFRAPGNNAEVGRHGGFAFAASRPTRRLTGDFSGYVVDWIDRAADHGFRLTLYDGLLELPLVAGGPHMPDEPPLHWQIDVTETAIQVRGDGVLYIDAPKLTISGGGHFGFWAWGQGQNVAIDNLVAEDAPFQAHFRREPAAPFAGAPVTLNALSSSVATGVEVAAYDWDFGDGATGTGPIVSHVYGVPGDPLVTLTVTDRLGRRSTYQEHFRVHQPLVPFTDCFDGQTGTPARWHALAGVWGVGNGMLIGLDDEQESHGVIWAGATPGVLPLDFTAEIDLAVEPPSFSPEPFTGGVVFCATEPVHFEQGPHGYAVTLTPLEPRGERLGLHYLVHGQRETVQEVDLVDGIRPRPGRSPFLRLRVEVAGELIRLLANGEPVIEFADLNFRGGFFGLFTEGGALLRADNVRLPPRRPPCTLAIETFTIKEDPGHIYIQGTGSGGDPCLGPEECGCAEVGVTVEGFKEVRLPGGNPLLARIPVPEGCRPESQREVIARCIEEGTLFGTPEATKFTCPEPPPPVGGNRLPGDCNADGALNISDPICLLGFLFTGSPSRLPCGTGRADDPGNRSLLDHQGDRKIDLSDAVATLNYLFGGAAPPSLGRSCTPIAGCEREACRS